MTVKLYLVRSYLYTHYITLGKNAATIAKENGVTEATIYLQLKKFDLIKRPRVLKRNK